MKRILFATILLISVLTITIFADSALGEIVFKEDFEALSNPKSGGYITGSLSEEFGGGKILLYNGGVSGVKYGIESPVTGGSKMLYVSGSVQYPQARFQNFSLTKPGKYTLVYDYYVPDTFQLSFLQTNYVTVRRLGSIAKGTVTTVTETYEIKDSESTSLSKIGIESCKSTSAPESYGFYIDNVTLYYLAPQVDYGLLLGNVDFENTNSLDAKLVSPGSGTYEFGSKSELSTEIPSDVSSAQTMMMVKSDGQKAPAAGYANLEITRPGTYTVVFDYYMPSDYTCSWFKVRTNLSDMSVTPVKGSLKKNHAVQFRVEDGDTVNKIYFQSYNNGKAITGSYYIDNIRLYLEPDEYLFSDFAYNLVTTFIGDAKTQRGFAWTADKKCQNMVIRYAKKEDGLENAYKDVPGYYEEYEDKFYYKADVTDLEPGTEYVYIVGDTEKDVWSDEYPFVTEAENTNEFSFIAITDPQGATASNYQKFDSVLKAGFEKDTDAKFVVSLGDMVEYGYDEYSWKMYFDSFDGVCAEIPNMAVVGNHETREGEAGKNFRLHFNNPDNGHTALGSLTVSDMSANHYKELVQNVKETVYSFDYGNVHFAVINTGSDWSVTTDGIKFAKAQMEWLASDLEKSDAEWKILMLHQGLYPAKESRYWGLREIYEALLCDMGVDLVLQGHDHMVARTYPMLYGEKKITLDTDKVKEGDGIVYFIPGAAADKRYEDLTEVPDYMVKVINTDRAEPVYSVVSVDKTSLKVETFDVTDNILDSFVIEKNNYFICDNKTVTLNASIDRTDDFVAGFAVVVCKDIDGRLVNTFIRTLKKGINDIGISFVSDTDVAEIEVLTMGELKLLQPVAAVTVLEKVE